MICLRLSLKILFLSLIISSSYAQNGSYSIDVKNSEVEWTGYHAGQSYEHWGTLKAKSGSIVFADGNISKGEIVIDMNTLLNQDLIGELDKNKLTEHLKSEEFFNVEKFPEAKLTVKKSELVKKGIFNVTADLTIKGITKEVKFEAQSLATFENGYKISAQLTFNRINFDVLFGWSVEDAMIDKEIKLDVILILRQSDKLLVNTETSEVEWTGYHPGKSYEHWGTLKVKEGYISFIDGVIKGGELLIDMTTLANTDLTNESDRKQLDEHLKSKDFFDVEQFPIARLVIKKAEKVQNGEYKITADITIKDITKEINFSAYSTSTYDNGTKFSAELTIDRTAHKVMFGWAIEDAMIDKEIKLDVLLICK